MQINIPGPCHQVAASLSNRSPSPRTLSSARSRSWNSLNVDRLVHFSGHFATNTPLHQHNRVTALVRPWPSPTTSCAQLSRSSRKRRGRAVSTTEEPHPIPSTFRGRWRLAKYALLPPLSRNLPCDRSRTDRLGLLRHSGRGAAARLATSLHGLAVCLVTAPTGSGTEGNPATTWLH